MSINNLTMRIANFATVFAQNHCNFDYVSVDSECALLKNLNSGAKATNATPKMAAMLLCIVPITIPMPRHWTYCSKAANWGICTIGIITIIGPIGIIIRILEKLNKIKSLIMKIIMGLTRIIKIRILCIRCIIIRIRMGRKSAHYA